MPYRVSARMTGLVLLLIVGVLLGAVVFFQSLIGIPLGLGEVVRKTPLLPTPPLSTPRGGGFVDTAKPVLRREFPDFVEYELWGSFEDIPKENSKGEYVGTFVVGINGEVVRVPVLLGSGDLSTFIGLHSGTTVASPSKYEVKTVDASIPLIALKVQKPTVIRVKTRLTDRQDSAQKPCSRYCQYLRGWVSAHGNESEKYLDSLINASPEKFSRNLNLFIVQVGFLEAQ